MNHPTNEHGLLQEIEEDLQRQKFEALWKKFGPFILGAAAAVVLVTGLVTGWQSYRLGQSQKTTEALWRIADGDAGENVKNITALEDYAKSHGSKVQAVFARFYAAGEAEKAGQKDKALEIYSVIESDASVDPVFRQMASLLFVQSSMDSADPKMLEDKLLPLMEKADVWGALAGEYAGHLAVRRGDKEKAKTYFLKVLARDAIPESIGQRAAIMLEWLEGE